MALSKAAHSYDMELDMFCEEEPLDVNALEAYQRAQYDYILVEKLIEEARKNGVEVFYINTPEEMNSIPLPAGLEDADVASLTPDIIVLDEELALARSAKMAAKQLAGVSAVLGRVGPAQANIIRLPTSSPAGMKRSATTTGGPATKNSKTELLDNDPGTLVPLEEYYYGKQEGDPTYHEEKGEYRFKCWYCHKMLYNNIRIMMHMQGHIDSEKQQNIDLSDLTQCKHCYKQLDTPFEMQRHIEQVHQAQSNALVCRICEKDHKNESELRTHMRQFHRACEMPYVCQLCNFRSSFYSDVVDHFKKRHDSSTFVSCLYCLRVFQVRFSKSGGWGLTQNYYFHLQKHQTKASTKKCNSCKLTFFSKEDVAKHSKDHTSNYRGIIHGNGGVRAANDKVMITVPQKGQSVKSLNAPAVTKVQDMQGVRMYGLEARHLCLECQQPMMVPAHYKRFVECSLCRFASTCNQALSMHMMSMHSGIKNIRFKNFPWEQKMPTELYCLCGYSTFYGNLLANHLIQCSKRTAYTSKPDVKWIEYDDEHEEYNPFDDAAAAAEESEPLDDTNEPNIFGALGLVKKGVPAPKSRKGNVDLPVSASDVSSKKQADPDSSTTGSVSKQTRNKFSILQGGSFKKGEMKTSETNEGDVEMADSAEATSSTDAS